MLSAADAHARSRSIPSSFTEVKIVGILRLSDGARVAPHHFAQDDNSQEAMPYQTLQLAHDGGVATVTLNRPEKRNAISFPLIEELLGALDEVAKSEAKVLILT